MPTTDPVSTTLVTRFPDRARCETDLRHGRGGVFKTILRAATAVAAAAIPGAGPVIGAVAGAIDRGSSPLLGSFGGESEALRYLELQREIERETRMYETASNVMKARHDATMSSIRNLKS